jgi:hypothetical protein
VRVPHRFTSLIALIAGSLTAIGVMAARASAQVEITPLPTESPSSKLAPGTQWVNWMAIGAAVIVVLAVLAIASGYLRFAPKFFGREETVRPLAPGTRPASLTRQAARVRYAPPPPGEHRAATSEAPAPAQARTATAVAERPSPAAAPAPAETASERKTAPPSGEPAAQADAVGQAEAEAPEVRPTAKTEEEVGTAPEPAPAAAAQAQPSGPAQPASTQGGGGEMDQETFDRVLEEQLGRGVDRRVAEGRARAAAVVAARKKAQG